MITYSTEIPIDEKTTVFDVVNLALIWIAGSPYSKIKKDELNKIPENSEIFLSGKDEVVTIASVKNSESEIGGIRYVRIENGIEWTTSIVALKESQGHILSVQVACESLTTAPLPSARKPYFIRQVFSKLKAGIDGVIPVSDKPFVMKEGEAPYAAEILNGDAKNRLPIIYVSANYDSTHSVDVVKLSRWVSGIAHVVVEPSAKFSVELKKLCKSRNVYGGSIGVYWPESAAKKIYHLESNKGREQISIEIEKDIRLALANRRQKTECNWLNLKEKLSRLTYEKLKAEGSVELNDYIKAFDDDLEVKEKKIAEAEMEIARLNSEIKRKNSNNSSSYSAALKFGEEQNIYDNEIQDIVIQSLKDALRNSNDESRKYEILSDLIDSNIFVGSAESLSKEIKATLSNYTELDQKTRAALIKIGFSIADEGKHHKAIFGGDGRYTFIISKTSSDHRAGKNLVSDINKKLF